MEDHAHDSNSRKLLGRLKTALGEELAGQERLDRVTDIIADAMAAEVCSIYLFRDAETLELSASKGLKPEAVHQTRMRVGEGLVGRVARMKRPLTAADAPAEPGFRYMPETGEEIYSSFLGVPIQRLGETLGVLVVQSKDQRAFSDDDVYGMEVVAMVLAEMTELGAFVGEGAALAPLHRRAVTFKGGIGQEGSAMGRVWLHEPRVVVANPIADDPQEELHKLGAAIDSLRDSVDELLANAGTADKEQMQILEAYRMFANSRGWRRRMEEDIARGLSAAAAVEKEQTATRARMARVPDPYLRERLHDLDDLSNRLLRILTGQGTETGAEMPDDP
ncbi:MAG TPA: GAF domain-containing protein, partial [Rhodobacterales bacterium]|nr:GAF domain-containing protein [Rhodobacterales bacterium]